jgi:hypothetical protein
MQADLERLPYWQEASGIVRDTCRVPAEIAMLSPVLTFFALILGLLMQFGATQSMLAPFRRMLGKLVLDAEGNVIGMVGVSVPVVPHCDGKAPDLPAAPAPEIAPRQAGAQRQPRDRITRTLFPGAPEAAAPARDGTLRRWPPWPPPWPPPWLPPWPPPWLPGRRSAQPLTQTIKHPQIAAPAPQSHAHFVTIS